MAQMTITLAFETLKAQLALAGKSIVLDEFVLANVPGLDPSTPIDRAETLPPTAQVVFTGDVTQSGFVSPNGVIYSLIMDTGIGDFSFNWIGLRNKEQNVLAAISHIPAINKIKSVAGVKNGNSVTRSMMMSYIGAQQATGITVNAATWQIDFTARLTGIDNTERLANVDHYGKASFLNAGYQVFQSGSSYKTKAGTGYVGGLRCHASAEQVISNVANGMGIYLDASLQGGLTSQWQAVVSIKASAQVLTDYVDSTGLQHYLTKLADINSAGHVIDQRLLGGTPALERKDNAASNVEIDSESSANKHVKLTQFWRGISKKITAAFANRTISTTGPLKGGGNLSANRTFSIDNASTTATGVVQLSTSTTSIATTLAATPSAVKAAMDKANSKWTYVTATTSRYGAVQLENGVTSTSITKAATSNAVKNAYDRAVKAESNANTHTDNRVAQLLGGAPAAALDTIKELGDALQGNDSEIAAINATISTKAAKSALAAHVGDKGNPHGVTKTHVGLGHVNNWPATSATNDASTTKYAVAAAVKTAMDKAIAALDRANASVNQSVIETLFPVGHLLITVNVANPTTYGYPGVWVMQGADMTLLSTKTASGVNKITGTNTPAVPVPRHRHTASFSGNQLPNHSHGIDAYGGWNNLTPSYISGNVAPSGHRVVNSKPASAGRPSGSVSVSDTGVANATLDVRGKHLTVYMWLRTA
ncbi:phage tail protein [Moritella sp. Urea-trap-13]|uniref:phage tail-collar fiber domain-containing protein n=1 Tax=Moritella sp. Urea-trap-13 TaxID=2058327 RepID=UPI0018E2DCC1|nr:phage tail protein [Moritella sp. Urea-trap-13]